MDKVKFGAGCAACGFTGEEHNGDWTGRPCPGCSIQHETPEVNKVTQDSVSEPEKLTVAEALQMGGWFYFVGTISGIYATAITGAHYIYIPKPIDQPSDHVIPFWGEWLEASRFNGDWHGPISPPI